MNFEVLLCLTAANVLAGLSYPVASAAFIHYSPIELVFWRILIGTVLFSPWLFNALRAGGISRNDWRLMAAVGVLGYGVPSLLGAIGQFKSSSTHAVLLGGIEPVSIVLMAALFLGEDMTALQGLAIALGMTGAGMIVLQGASLLSAREAPNFYGDILLALTGLFWSLHTLWGKQVLRRVDPLTFTAVSSAFSLIPSALAASGTLAAHPSPLRGASALTALLYLGVGATFLATMLWNLGLGRVKASALANMIFVQPLVGVLGGVLFLHDRLTGWTILGGTLILLGVYLAAAAKNSSWRFCISAGERSSL